MRPHALDGPHRDQGPRPAYSLSRLMFVFFGLILALTPWTAEYFIERFSHAAARGRIKAEYEHALARIGEHSSPLHEISLGSQLVFQKIRPSVVSIHTKQSDDLLEPNSQGSGFVISADGYIVTNHHVVDSAERERERVFVEMEGHLGMYADVVGFDTTTDLAVLKVDAQGLIPIEWGDSDQLQIGSLVWAVGSPYGLQNSITQGIISGTQRQGKRDDKLQTFLQTDAAVNPGNSGGPLVDEQGKVVGVNTLIYGQRYQGISFAVPGNLCREMCEQLIHNGRVVRGFFGVTPRNVLAEDVAAFGLPSTQGAVAEDVQPGTPAARAGLRAGDVITHWNGRPVPDRITLFRMIWLTPPHSRATVDFLRDGAHQSVEVVVERNTHYDE